MFGTYLRRELSNRRRQTITIAIGMALAIALVIIVNSVAAGVKNAQATVLESLYGVGTDITVTATPEPPAEDEGGGQRFEFGTDDGATEDGTTSVSQSRLEAGRGTSTFDAAAVATAASTDGVVAAVGVLSLTNTTVDGELPDFSQMQRQPGADGSASDGGQPPAGGPDGAGGSAFDIAAFTVLGIDPSADAIGPLTAAELSDGRVLDSADAGADVALLDSSYATEEGLAVGDTVDIAGTSFEVVGVVASTTSDGESASNVYIPLDVAQTLAGLDGQVSSVYVQASSADGIDTVKADLEEALPEMTVSTQEDLAASVAGSVSTASSMITSLGTWLSLIVLLAAFLVAILFTISGVTRRTREFGTLKALGWSNRRIVGQVAGESLVQGAIGGVAGIALGLVGILVVNLIAPTIGTSGATATGGGMPGDAMQGGGMPGGGAMPGGFGAQAALTTSEVVLQLPVTVAVVGIAVGLALLGGLLAGAFGGWRAARLRPAAAFRSVD
ncbi:ABC transporter permease [Herbiconiux sp. L3-i23]|uniref:ABC transporter permease n=1 Tax=Herbiconiux sp. L3-i23 TaxID=2905871 RepID=UPI002059B03A|nr:ABC transporter permease [Herbiconiux sp. L3-i23]BDI21401.1 membrane protein [Herbiconiux sp. L3-i23]